PLASWASFSVFGRSHVAALGGWSKLARATTCMRRRSSPLSLRLMFDNEVVAPLTCPIALEQLKPFWNSGERSIPARAQHKEPEGMGEPRDVKLCVPR